MVIPAKIVRVPLHCSLSDSYRGAFSVIGNMDGVHKGHQILIRKGVDLAKRMTSPAAVVVFDPHPRRVFQPDAPSFLLTQIETKAQILGELGVDFLFVLPFIEDLHTQTAEAFVKHTLGEIMGIKGIITGTDFRFGAGRSGDISSLARLAGEVGIKAETLEPILMPDKEKYSSSVVRQALRDGSPEIAADMLGRPFVIRGEVIEGRKLGRTLGFPTANLELGTYLRPKFGVYAVSAEIGVKTVRGVANIGIRPTIDGTAELLEVFFFDFSGDLYGQTLDIQLHHFIRSERKFDDLDALKTQINADSRAARDWLSNKLA